MKSILLLSVVCLSLSLMAFSCQDHVVPEVSGDRLRLKRVILGSGNVAYSITYNYNSAGKVVSAIPVPVPGSRDWKDTLVYDAQGRLISYRRTPPPGLQSSLALYTYDANGNVASIENGIISLSGVYNRSRTLIFEYNGTQSPVKITSLNSSGVPIDAAQLTYANGNIVRIDRTDSTNGTVTTSTFQYDDKPNPFYQFPVYPSEINSQSIFGLQFLNRNNYLTPNMVYNSNGLITSRSIGQTPTTYEYEAY